MALGTTSAVLAVITAGLVVAIVALVWLYAQRDSDGFVESRTVTLSTDGYAVASEELDFEGVPDEWLPANLVGTFRVEAESATGPVFIGVTASSSVDEYLDGVAHSRVSSIGTLSRLDYREVGGRGAAEDPEAQDFWTTTARGEGKQQIEWEAESGEWTIVVMNADASKGVEVAASMAINNEWLSLAILLVGVVTLLIGGLALLTGIKAFRSSNRHSVEAVDNPELTRVAG
jgi:hypothetical protein